MSTYERVSGVLKGKKGKETYTLNYRLDKPLPAFVLGRGKDLVFNGMAEIEWLADAARNARDLTKGTGKGWVNHEGPPNADENSANLIVRDYTTHIRDSERNRISLGWAGLDWIADDLAPILKKHVKEEEYNNEH